MDVVAPPQRVPVPSDPWISLGGWDYYFFAKFFLYFGGFIGFHFFPNLALALFLAISMRYGNWEKTRRLVMITLAMALFYYDTWLPPLSRLLSHAKDLSSFELSYLIELVGRFIHPWAIAGLLLLYGAYRFLKTQLRMTSFLALGMLATLLVSPGESTTMSPDRLAALGTQNTPRLSATQWSPPPPKEGDLVKVLDSFYASEADRWVNFTAPQSDDPPFDIVLLQVCSLSWDDLDYVGELGHPLMDQFDILFTDFNSASSYSGPAVLRLLRSSAGQPRHASLYGNPDSRAHTFDNLRRVGYETQWAMNHDGKFGNFLNDIRVNGGLKVSSFNPKSAAPYLTSFDGSRVLDDYSLLSKWWEQRLANPSARVAFFYNTISLHDGNRLDASRLNSLDSYRQRARKLLADISNFMALISASKRNVVVVFVPEHGASLRGDKMQIAGMREIPSYAISRVPVGVKLVGAARQGTGKPVSISNPSSYLALSQLLADLIARNPFRSEPLYLEEIARNLPVTGFVSENADTIVMRYGKQYFMQPKESTWVEYIPAR